MTSFWLNVVPQPDGSHRSEQGRRMTLAWYGCVVTYLITTVVMVYVFGINYQGSEAEYEGAQVAVQGNQVANPPDDGVKPLTRTATVSTDAVSTLMDEIDIEAAEEATEETTSAIEDTTNSDEDVAAEAAGAVRESCVMASNSTKGVEA